MGGEWNTPRPFDVAPSRTCGLVAWAVALGLTILGCETPSPLPPPRPDVSPRQRIDTARALSLDASEVTPMYTELLAIDLPAVVRVAGLQNIEILQAQESVEASKGKYESAVGSIFPALVPTALFEHVRGGGAGDARQHRRRGLQHFSTRACHPVDRESGPGVLRHPRRQETTPGD